MTDEDGISTSHITLSILAIILLIGFLFYGYPYLLETTIGYVDVIEIYVVTDKWTVQEGGFLWGSSTEYYLELDNESKLHIDDFEWHQYKIGDEYIIEKRVLDIEGLKDK